MQKGLIMTLWLSACCVINLLPTLLVQEMSKGVKLNRAIDLYDAIGVNTSGIITFITWVVFSLTLFFYTYRKILNATNAICKKITDTIKEPDSQYYGQAEQEIIDGTVDQGLWAKALVAAKGNDDLRKAEYIKLRAKQLQQNKQ